MKKFEQLLIAGIEEDITGSTVERLTKVKAIFESEMLWEGHKRDMDTIKKRLQDWLQGLCGTVYIPYMNYDIVEWYEKQLGRKSKNDNERCAWAEKYWPQAASTLYKLLYG